MSDRQEDLALLREAAAKGAALALDMQARDVDAWSKSDGSPVSAADMAVDTYLKETLTRARPDCAWLSEETADDPARLDARRVLIADPIDGTRGYLAGGRDWAVALALVEDGRPVVGVLAAPARHETYFAVAGEGAWLEAGGETRRLAPSPRTYLEGARLAGTRRAVERLGGLGAEIVPYVPSLALRLAFVAAGTLHAAIAHEGAKDWDLAAADLILGEAGGLLTDAQGDPLTYNRPSTRHPALVAAIRAASGPDLHTRDLHAPLRETLRALLIRQNASTPSRKD